MTYACHSEEQSNEKDTPKGHIFLHKNTKCPMKIILDFDIDSMSK